MSDIIIPWRITFCKCWTGRFLSHIDTMRAWSRALRRTGMPIYYTRGFNPKPKMSYLTPPMSVGQTSECETLDFRMEMEIMPERLFEELEGKAPSGSVFLGAMPSPPKFPAITRMDYLLLLQDENCPMPDVDQSFLVAGADSGFLSDPEPATMDHVRAHKLTFSKTHHPAQFFDRAFRVSFRIDPLGGSPVKAFSQYLDSFGIIHHLHRLSFHGE
jgi:hypothetical protein